MKRIMLLLLVGLMLVFVGSVFADHHPSPPPDPMDNLIDKHEGTVSNHSGPSSSLDLHACVGKYAAVGWTCADSLTFTGYAYETQYGDATVRVESNCDVLVKVNGIPFHKDEFYLKSHMKVGSPNDWVEMRNNFAEQEIGEPHPAHRGITDYEVDYKAQLGRISNQPAGSYDGKLIATVYAAY